MRVTGLPILRAVGLAVALAGGVPGHAQQADLHDLFETRCAGCHGHSGDFARATLSVSGGRVVGSRGQDLGAFLLRHRGGVSETDAARLLDMFRAQIESGGLFQDRCLTCHGSARDFARIKLILRNGVLFGRYSGREVAPFLVGHARMDAAEAERMTQALRAILAGGR